MDDDTDAEPTGRLLSKEEAAAYLGGAPITVRTIEGLVRRREIGFVRIGRAVVFPRTALDDYIASHTIAPSPNAWGLTDASLARVRAGRATRKGAAA